VGFGRLGSFGFLKRWFVCREKPNVPNALAKNFLSCALGIFYFFLCRTVVWSDIVCISEEISLSIYLFYNSSNGLFICLVRTLFIEVSTPLTPPFHILHNNKTARFP